MSIKLSKITFTAAFGFALAFTLSCSGGGGGDDNGGGNAAGGSGGSCNIGDYRTVQIGTQLWMAENWNCNVNGSKCYDNDPANCAKYGRLYGWTTAMAACPSGWHLPSDAEWNVLMKFVNPSCSDNNYYCNDAGTKLKSASGWISYSGVPLGTDKFGFSALPGDNGSSNGNFGFVGYGGYWWSATETSDSLAYCQYMDNNNAEVDRSHCYKSTLYSVRCVQD
jgi:uncharacterized protein (TIGR02145 family)